MSPPYPRQSTRLAVVPPIPREETPQHSEVRDVAPSVPPTREAAVDDRLDALTWDQRELVEGSRWQRRRARRNTRVLVGVSARTRRIERGQWLLAADVSRALAPVHRRATVAAASPIFAALVYLAARLFGE